MRMKEIKAFIRPTMADAVVHGMASAGVKAMTITPVEAIGALANESSSRMSLSYYKKYSCVYKIELICRQDDEDRIVHLIQQLAHTGKSGDGVIFISPIERAVKIRTGEEGHFILDRATNQI